MEVTGEILKAGTWNGVKFTSDDLDKIIASFDFLGLKGRVPLKLGHDDRKDDAHPALGWVDKVWRVGDTLHALFTDVPPKVHEVIARKFYKFVSVELMRNVSASTRVIPWVLDGVALLGATQPAVGNLAELVALTAKRKASFSSSAHARVSLSRDVVKFTTGGKMPKSLEELTRENEELQTKLASLEASNVKLSKDFETVSANLKASTESTDKLVKELKDAKDATTKEKITLRRKAIKDRIESVTGITAGKMKPAQRDRFYKLTKIDNDEAVMEIKDEEVEEYLKDAGVSEKQIKMSADPQTQQQANEEEGLDPDEILLSRAKKLCFARQWDPTKNFVLERATAEVLRDPKNKDLAESYKHMHDAA